MDAPELYLPPTHVRRKKRHPKQWEPWEDRELERLYPNHTNHWLADYFNVTPTAIGARAYKLQLKKDYNWRSYIGKTSGFPKGNKPWNYNKKNIRMSRETEFKPGHKPVQTKFDGAISIRYDNGKPYYFIRLEENNWVALHRHIWENINKKKIPEGHVLRFKDYNTLNCDINNLLLVTRQENALMNVNRKKQAETQKGVSKKRND
jgi:hypothetical protein